MKIHLSGTVRMGNALDDFAEHLCKLGRAMEGDRPIAEDRRLLARSDALLSLADIYPATTPAAVLVQLAAIQDGLERAGTWSLSAEEDAERDLVCAAGSRLIASLTEWLSRETGLTPEAAGLSHLFPPAAAPQMRAA